MAGRPPAPLYCERRLHPRICFPTNLSIHSSLRRGRRRNYALQRVELPDEQMNRGAGVVLFGVMGLVGGEEPARVLDGTRLVLQQRFKNRGIIFLIDPLEALRQLLTVERAGERGDMIVEMK